MHQQPLQRMAVREVAGSYASSCTGALQAMAGDHKEASHLEQAVLLQSETQRQLRIDEQGGQGARDWRHLIHVLLQRHSAQQDRHNLQAPGSQSRPASAILRQTSWHDHCADHLTLAKYPARASQTQLQSIITLVKHPC